MDKGPLAYLTAVTPEASPFIAREIRQLRKLGWEIHAFAIRRGEFLYDEASAESPTTHILPVSWLVLLRDHLATALTRPGGYLSALWFALARRPPGLKHLLWQLFYFAEAVCLWRRVRARGIRHVHVHFSMAVASVAMIACRLGGLEYSLTVHGPTEFVNPAQYMLVEKVNRARFIACISSYCRSQVLALAGDGVRDKLHIIHCGVDTGLYRPVADRLVDRGRPVLLSVGRLVPVKGYSVLLRALHELVARGRQLHCKIIGDGPDRSYLEGLARDLGLAGTVSFLGNVPQSRITRYYEEADIFVLPSFAEGLPVVLMEAMAMGLPVIATRITGIPELVDDGVNGILVTPSDEGQLAAAVHRLCSNPLLCREIAEKARSKVVAEFEIDGIARELSSLFSRFGCTKSPAVDGLLSPLGEG